MKKLIFVANLVLLVSAYASQLLEKEKSATENMPQKDIDDLIFNAYKRFNENKSQHPDEPQSINFILSHLFFDDYYFLTLTMPIDLDELDQSCQVLPVEKTFLRTRLLDAFGQKYAEQQKQLETTNGVPSCSKNSLRNYLTMSQTTKCRIVSTDNFNQHLECRTFIDALRYHQLKDKIHTKVNK